MGQPVAISYAAYKRSGFPEAVLLNMIVERAPTQQNAQVALLARPGLEAFQTVGSPPLRAIFQKQGLFSNAAIILAATEVWTLTASGTALQIAGAIPGDNRVDIDAGRDADLNSVCRVATGDALYKITTGAITREAFPVSGGVGASSICEHRGFWFATETGTGRVYYQIPGDTIWRALSFASAEYSPDNIVAVRSRGDQFALLGETTTEIWALTGSASPAIAPYGGLNFDFGCRSRASAVNCQGILIWVDDECGVREFAGGDATLISDNGLAEQIRRVNAADIRASTFAKDQHIYYVLTLGTDATWVYDLSTKVWSRFNSLTLDYWLAHLFCNIGDAVLAADAQTAQVYRLDPDRLQDASSAFTREWCAFIEAKNGPVPCVNLELSCEVGNSPLAGQGSDPLIRMSYSDDGGKTYGRFRDRSLGATGKYNTRVRWNALGDVPSPNGRIIKFQLSDPVGRRVSELWMNVP